MNAYGRPGQSGQNGFNGMGGAGGYGVMGGAGGMGGMGGQPGMPGQNMQNGGGYVYNAGEGERVMQKIRDGLSKRGNRTIRCIGRTFRLLDSYDSNRKVEPQEFAVGMKENGITLTPQELQVVVQYLDRDGNGFIDYDEFLYAVRGRPNKVRQDTIDRAFGVMDRDKSGYIDKQDLLSVYDVSKHPKFNSGKSAGQIQDEFLENFGDSNKDGKITKKEWDDYYAAVSASIDNDEHFVLLMERAWKMKK